MEASGAVVRPHVASSPSYQAYQLLHVGFVVAPLVAGADKFFGFLTNWDQYLAPAVSSVVPAHPFMLAVGVIEMVAAVLVAVKPRWGAYVVALWLLGIIINLLLLGRFYDIALRDLGLMLG